MPFSLPVRCSSSTAYDRDGNATETIDADNNTTLYAFDKADQLTLTTDPRGFTTQQSYDLAGNETQVISADGGTVSTSYDGDANPTKIVNADGFTTLQSFDADDRLTKTVTADGFTSTTAFDGDSRVTKTTDGVGNTVTTAYDADSNVTKTIDGAGATTLESYDAADLLTAAVDGRGYTTDYSYDPDSRLTKTVDPDSHSVLTSYDPAGQVTKTVNADGYSVLTSFDPAGLPTKVVDGDGYTTVTSFDPDDRATKVVDGDGHTSLSAYDPNGNVTLATDGAGVTTQTAFDPDGNVNQSVVNGYTTTSRFDGDDNLTASIDGDGDTTTNGYDPADQLTKVTDPDSNVTSYTLDGDGNTTLVTSPQGYTTQQKFDGDDRITQQITPDGSTINFSYDGDGRLTSDGNGTRTYNADGLLTTAANSYGTYVFGYDPDDRITQVSEPFGQSLNYAYDPAGNQTKVTDSQGGTESSTYDGDNYLTARSYVGQGQTLLVKYTNNEEGWNTTLARYSDLAGTTLVATSKYQYDGAGNVTNVVDTGPTGGTIDEFVYALDSNGNLTSETDTQGGTPTTTDYAYDSAGQLTSAGTSSYGYDAAGNRDAGSDTVTTGNEMSADANWDYTYNKEGALTEADSTVVGSSEKWTYAWSANGNLDEVKHYNSSGTLVLDVTYEYDAFGEMIQKSDGTVTSRYAEDGWNSNMAAPTGNENMNTWAVLNGSNQWQERDIWGNQVGQELGRIVLSANNYTLYPMQDRQESVRDVVTAAGVVDDAIAYDAFGNITSETNSAYRGSYAWTGRQFDVETNLQYNNARWYDPKMGRWISQDPLGFDAGDSNLYRYVSNRPILSADPSGNIGIFFEGTSQPKNSGDIIDMLFQNYKGAKEIFFYPDLAASGDQFWEPIEKAISLVVAAYKKGDKALDIFGYSRGAAAALVMASELARDPSFPKDENIRYVGAIDPNTLAAGPLKYTKRAFKDSKNIPNRDFLPITKLAWIPAAVKNIDIFYTPGQPKVYTSNKVLENKLNYSVVNRRLLPGYENDADNDHRYYVVTDVGHWQAGFDSKIGHDIWQRALAAGVPLDKNIKYQGPPDGKYWFAKPFEVPTLTDKQPNQLYPESLTTPNTAN